MKKFVLLIIFMMSVASNVFAESIKEKGDIRKKQSESSSSIPKEVKKDLKIGIKDGKNSFEYFINGSSKKPKKVEGLLKYIDENGVKLDTEF